MPVVVALLMQCVAWQGAMLPALSRVAPVLHMVALPATPAIQTVEEEAVVPLLSGLKGKALKEYDVPTKVRTLDTPSWFNVP